MYDISIMISLTNNNPIGIFDSGIGGLTIASSLVKHLPNESVIYFGDTAHLPYGDKSKLTIQNYTKTIIDFLLSRQVKLILIACNTASAAAYETIQEYVGNQIPIVNVIDPMVDFLTNNYAGKNLGLIGTKFTVQSNIYHEKISAANKNITFSAVAAPLLVPIIEEGFFEHHLIDVALHEYLKHPDLNNIDGLVLGCTHYPIIKAKISNFYRQQINIIDAAEITAQTIKAILLERNLLAQNHQVSRHFYVSDYTDNFANSAKMFFGEDIGIELIDIFN